MLLYTHGSQRVVLCFPFTWDLGTEFRSSGLCNKRFTHRAISLAHLLDFETGYEATLVSNSW